MKVHFHRRFVFNNSGHATNYLNAVSNAKCQIFKGIEAWARSATPIHYVTYFTLHSTNLLMSFSTCNTMQNAIFNKMIVRAPHPNPIEMILFYNQIDAQP